MLIDGIAVFLISILTGMGLGSAGLLVTYFTLFRNLGQLQAQGINLFLFVCSASFSLILQIRKKLIKPHIVFPMIISGSLGSILGYNFAHVINPSTIRFCFALLLIVSGVISIVKTVRKSK